MVNAALGPDQDLARRLAELEGRVAALATTFGSAPISVSPTAAPPGPSNLNSVPVVTMTGTGSNQFIQLWYAYFPYNLPNLSYIIEGSVTPGTANGYFQLLAGPITSTNGDLTTLIDSWDSVNNSGGANLGANRYRGFLNMNPSPSWIGGVPGTVSLQGTPAQVGEMWAIELWVAADSGATVTIQMPMFQTRP